MSKLNSPLFLFLSSKEFFETGTNYASKYFKVRDGILVTPIDNFVHVRICIAAVNISFALELVFKGLLMHSEKIRKGHSLSKLFALINPNLRQEIIDHYNAHDYYKQYAAIKLITGDGSKHGVVEGAYPIIKNAEAITKLLATHDRAFEKFRYLFEIKDGQEYYFHFREVSNLTFSAIFTLGQALGHKVVIKKATEGRL